MSDKFSSNEEAVISKSRDLVSKDSSLVLSAFTVFTDGIPIALTQAVSERVVSANKTKVAVKSRIEWRIEVVSGVASCERGVLIKDTTCHKRSIRANKLIITGKDTDDVSMGPLYSNCFSRFRCAFCDHNDFFVDAHLPVDRFDKVGKFRVIRVLGCDDIGDHTWMSGSAAVYGLVKNVINDTSFMHSILCFSSGSTRKKSPLLNILTSL